MSDNPEKRLPPCTCKDCADRTERCHATCKKYKEFRAAADEAMETRRKQQRAKDLAEEYRKDNWHKRHIRRHKK